MTKEYVPGQFHVIQGYKDEKPLSAERVVDIKKYYELYQTRTDDTRLSEYANQISKLRDTLHLKLCDQIRNAKEQYNINEEIKKKELPKYKSIVRQLIDVLGTYFHCESIGYIQIEGGYVIRMRSLVKHGLVEDEKYEELSRAINLNIEQIMPKMIGEALRTSFFMAIDEISVNDEKKKIALNAERKNNHIQNLLNSLRTSPILHSSESLISYEQLKEKNPFIQRWYTGKLDYLQAIEGKDAGQPFGALKFGSSTQLLYGFGNYIIQLQRNKVVIGDVDTGKKDDVPFYKFEVEIIDDLVALTFQEICKLEYSTKPLLNQFQSEIETAPMIPSTDILNPIPQENFQQVSDQEQEDRIKLLFDELTELKNDPAIAHIIKLKQETSELRHKTTELEKTTGELVKANDELKRVQSKLEELRKIGITISY